MRQIKQMLIKNKRNICLLFLAIIVVIIIRQLFYSIVETFGSNSTSALAFETPALKKWMFETSKNRWYRVVVSSLFQTSTLGFTDRNPKFSASFLYTCNSGSTSWRNIFRFSNTTTGADGEPEGRVPGLWLNNDNLNRFHFRFPTDSNWNDGIDTNDIPFEGIVDEAINGVGKSQWFWRKIPLEKINFGGDSFIALWSNSIYLESVSSSPILAAAWERISRSDSGDEEAPKQAIDTWLNSDIKGMPPRDPKNSLKTAITYFKPAIAIKLIPMNTYKVNVGMTLTTCQGPDGDEVLISAFIVGVNIEKAWVEYSTDKRKWEKLTVPCWAAPYQFVINKYNSPSGIYSLRVVAVDELGNRGESSSLELTAMK